MQRWPELFEVRQEFDRSEIADVGAAVRAAWESVGGSRLVPRGGRVAVTAGSRGVDRIPEILRTVAGLVREAGARPFVLAAMGSHGGATAAGELEVLAGYGITEASVGCPVEASTEAREVGRTPAGDPALCNRLACEADGVVVVNRVKPHTILTGAQGSGMMKMMAIGLGGPAGAESIHGRGLPGAMLPTARAILRGAPILCGIGVVENSFDRVCRVEAALPDAMEETDRRLLEHARSLLPNVPFDPIDVLVVRRMGKNLSGLGMDPNVIGMHRRLGGAPERTIERIVALDLTPESHGNAIGVGMADLITERLAGKIDWQATRANAFTSMFYAGIKLPVALASEREAVAMGLKGLAPDRVRMVLIRDTAHLDRMWVTARLAAEALGQERLRVAEAPSLLSFTPEGDLAGPG